MATIVVDIRGRAGRIPHALCVGLDELPGWTGEVLRLAQSDLDAKIVVLGSTRHQAERGAEVLCDAGFVSVHPWTAQVGAAPSTVDPARGVSAR